MAKITFMGQTGGAHSDKERSNPDTDIQAIFVPFQNSTPQKMKNKGEVTKSKIATDLLDICL